MGSTKKIAFGIQDIFTLASRERCMTNMKKVSVPKFGRLPTTSIAVLVPVCRVNNIPSLLYTVRASHILSSRGQISFPGGKIRQEESPVEAAVRHTVEGIGLLPQKLDIWGVAPAVPARDNRILITPVIASIACLLNEELNLNPSKVSEAFTVPINMLCDKNNQFHTQYRNGYVLPVYVAENFKIWGMTAYITHMFLSSVLSKDVYNNQWLNKKIVIDQ